MFNKKILAVSASLRNARWGKGVGNLISRIKEIKDERELFEFIGSEAKVHFDQFLEAGRKDGIPFDDLYKNLRKLAGKKGLCNSEVGMVVALWAAHQAGCDIDYVPLSSHFGPTGKERDLDQLKQQLLSIDGLLLCTPVYFGDRSSLASDFIEFIRQDEELVSALTDKPMSGVAVGAKRNGGQETTLIYQILEMTSIGMLGLGNDTETTSQYGGTIKAGDIGTACDDLYGLKTSMGSGRRLAQIVKKSKYSAKRKLEGKIRVMFWLLQDSDDFAMNEVNNLIALAGNKISATVIKSNDSDVGRCIACDICPIHVGPDEEYRCIVKRKTDMFFNDHREFLDFDMIVPVAFSPIDRTRLTTVYQRFIERTRYFRRGDYLFSDLCVMPLVYEEIGVSENLHIRLLTSLIRHHTVMLRSNVGYIHDGKMLNKENVEKSWLHALEVTEQLTISRLSEINKNKELIYNPVGYILSAAAAEELTVDDRSEMIHKDREKRLRADAKERLQK